MKDGASTINLDDRFWSAATVAAAVEAKQSQRQLKSRATNCFTVRYYDTDASPATPEKDKFELENFLLTLKESIEKGNFSGDELDANRFQLLVQHGAHWTPLDFTIKDGKLTVISMDSAATPSEMDTIDAIKKHFPDTTFYSLGPSAVTQMDNDSCSRFSLDMLAKMQNVEDPVALLEAHTASSDARVLPNYDKAKGFTGKEIQLAPKDIPNEMAFMLRNVQSGTSLNNFPARLLDSPVNKTGTTLREYAESHSKMVDVDGTQKKRYMAIESVKESISGNTESYLAGLTAEEQAQIRENAKGHDYISSSKSQRQQMNSAQVQTFSHEVRKVAAAKEHIRITPEKKGLFSMFSKTNKELEKSRKIVKEAAKAEQSSAGPSSEDKGKKRRM